MPDDPRYDGPPLIRLDLTLGDPAVAMLRQRARLAEALAGLDEDDWTRPSRCAEWSIYDVVSHLVTVNQFWALSIRSGRDGHPTRYLLDFDPVETPAQLVAAGRGLPVADQLAAFVESNAALAASVEGCADDDWSAVLAEGPAGHLSLECIALHALWDGWVHERDVLLPLGRAVAEEDDEVLGSLAYVAGLGPAFLVARGAAAGRQGSYVVDGHDPGVRVVVEITDRVRVHGGEAPPGAPVLGGPAVDLLEAMSVRAPLDLSRFGQGAWMLGGLVTAFGG